jgi:ABC-type enterochelin transport system ATPase subunit
MRFKYLSSIKHMDADCTLHIKDVISMTKTSVVPLGPHGMTEAWLQSAASRLVGRNLWSVMFEAEEVLIYNSHGNHKITADIVSSQRYPQSCGRATNSTKSIFKSGKAGLHVFRNIIQVSRFGNMTADM